MFVHVTGTDVLLFLFVSQPRRIPVKKIFLALSVLLVVVSTFASASTEQAPRPQILQQAAGDVAVGGMMQLVSADQVKQLVKQRQFDPPVMIKTVLPAGVVIPRAWWVEAIASPKIPTLLDLAVRDRQKMPDLSIIINA